MLDEKFLNPQIRKSEELRISHARAYFGEEIPEAFLQDSLRQFVQWYIQRSINAQTRYAEELVRQQLKDMDARNDKPEVKVDEVLTVSENDVFDQPSYKNKAIFRSEKHASRQAAQTLIRSSRDKRSVRGVELSLNIPG